MSKFFPGTQLYFVYHCIFISVNFCDIVQSFSSQWACFLLMSVCIFKTNFCDLDDSPIGAKEPPGNDTEAPPLPLPRQKVSSP